jgi:hypothetical protein
MTEQNCAASGKCKGRGVAYILSALILAVGIATAGLSVAHGLQGMKDRRVVTVKGLAERDVRADFVNWPLTFTLSGNDLAEVSARAAAAQADVMAFLTEAGIGPAEISPMQWRVVDLSADQYGSGQSAGKDRFIITAGVTLNSSKIDAVLALTTRTDELVKKGIVLGSSTAGFRFNSINSVKAEMLAEATRNARASADQFAKDSGAKVGSIAKANQGVITILSKGSDMDDSAVPDKVVRVVSTVDYYLVDE